MILASFKVISIVYYCAHSSHLFAKMCKLHLLLLHGLLIVSAAAAATLEPALLPIPEPCDNVVCPADAELQCPPDSAIREMLEINSVAETTPSFSNSNSSSSSIMGMPMPLPSDELFARCCLNKKCICNTCYIPDCSGEAEVVIELLPESMSTPGHCCGTYECRLEPNCTAARDTDYFWLQNCKRCQCRWGARICQQTCEEGNNNAFCHDKDLNLDFSDGESWKDGCEECECVGGEQKCVLPMCGHVDCPVERQVNLKGSCCPICWPECAPMPNEGYNVGYADQQPAGDATTPCQHHDFPNVVEVVHRSNYVQQLYPYIVLCLLIVILALSFYIRHLKAKQRSYRPVSNFDEKIDRV
ncbi:CG13252 [Drosophila busckii]|uniref:CG13252 n=1 Tax=Drosophila busckii TaxID=30019 RepID=A0A0M4ERL9_DROBS|nr:cysteine-rich motor neuron 1 protein [Drosophila busckii]ALC45130.1 CG13252 [Drosophila busckii]